MWDADGTREIAPELYRCLPRPVERWTPGARRFPCAIPAIGGKPCPRWGGAQTPPPPVSVSPAGTNRPHPITPRSPLVPSPFPNSPPTISLPFPHRRTRFPTHPPPPAPL